MRTLLVIAASAAALTATAAAASADTNVSGNVSGTWGLAGSPYVVTGDVRVPASAVLQIDAGVTVRFNGHHKLVVNGRLSAVGTASAPITFTRHLDTPASRGWGLRFVDAGAAASTLAHVVVEHCHASNGTIGTEDDDSGGGIFIRNASVLIEDSEIRYNASGFGGGIAVVGASSRQVTIRRNRIHHNLVDSTDQSIFSGGAGIAVSGAGAATDVRSNLIYENTHRAAQALEYEGGGGLYVDSGAPRIVNNTIWGNASPKGCGAHLLPFTSSAIVFANNIVWGNTGCVTPGQATLQVGDEPGQPRSAATVLAHNVVQGGFQLVYRNTLEGSIDGDATMTSDPRLHDPAAGVFELRAGSNAIDSASAAVAGYAADDFYALGRVDAPGVSNTGAGAPAFADRGAIEWTDGDGDTIADGADVCPGVADQDQRDHDADGLGDACDSDDDDDGAVDGDDCAATDDAIYPGATEGCDAIDSDCDGSLVDDFPDADHDARPDCIDPDPGQDDPAADATFYTCSSAGGTGLLPLALAIGLAVLRRRRRQDLLPKRRSFHKAVVNRGSSMVPVTYAFTTRRGNEQPNHGFLDHRPASPPAPDGP